MIFTFGQVISGESEDGRTVISSLSDFVDSTLALTTRVRRILENQCDEAHFVFRPWITETLVMQKAEEISCTCRETAEAEDSQADEIAKGIEKALLQAQQLRDTISSNVLAEKRRISKPSVHQIYASNKKFDVKLKFDNKSKNIEKIPKNQIEVSAKLSKAQNKAVEKGKPKNFIALNKSSVRTLSQRNSKSNTDLNKESVGKSLRCDSVAELDNLIKKVSDEALCNPQDKNCRMHGNSDNRETGLITEKKIKTTTDIFESLNQFGVPEGLLKTLRVYSSYANKDKEKMRSVKHKFFDDLESFHQARSKEIYGSKDVLHLATGFANLYRDLHHSRNTSLSRFKKIYEELNNLSGTVNIKRYDALKIRRSHVDQSAHLQSMDPGWLHIGIWNLISFRHFLMFREPLIIPYTNKNELLALFDSTQRLQYVIYTKKLQDFIINDLIPIMKELSPENEEYLNLYKMIFAIAQVLNLQEPVLVKMDD